jgi:hypothetical protein
VKTTLTPQDTNDLVRFFLELGGHYIDPDLNNDNPSRKVTRWELAGQNPAVFVSYLPGNYPLTGGLERVTVLRRLLDTETFFTSTLNPPLSNPRLDDCFRTRAYDHNGQQLWPDLNPPVPTDVPCVGPALRAVGWFEDQTLLPPQCQSCRGYQRKFLGMTGSYATLLALFPSTGGVESYFWCTPGVQAMGYDLRGPSFTADRFDLHMGAYATNTLMPSHYNDFLTNHVSVVYHYY